MSELRTIEHDNFIVGEKNNNHQPFEYVLPKVISYIKETKKSFEELTEEELKQFKIK